jgi:hypothetical protein
MPGILAFNPTEQIGLFHDEDVFPIERDFGAGVFAV